MRTKYIRIPLAALLLLALLMGLLPTAFAATGDEIRAAKKIISVAYDDSGSMKGNRWVNANYAMQALTALLNEQDSLYLTYMSEPDKAVQQDLSNIESAVGKIRDWDDAGGTPGQALDTAYAKLAGISESESTTQFWLVIMTDGDIDMPQTIQEKLDSFKGKKMSNGSTLNVVYLAMGSDHLQATEDTRNGLYTFHAADATAITKAMAQIANLISGRITADDVRKVDDFTITFTSPLPLYSISVLSQQSSAYVLSASDDTQALNLDRNIALNAKDPFGKVKTKLFGNAAVIHKTDGTSGSAVIPAGSYTITFSEPVALEDLVVQYEPAIGLRMIITRDGIQITDPADLLVDDKVTVEMVPVIPGTTQQIPASTLPHGLSWTMQYEVDGKIEDSRDSQRLSGVTLLEGHNVFRGILNIPGFAPSVYELPFDLVRIVYHFGIEVDQPDPLSYLRGDLDNRTGDRDLTFWLTNDGTRLSKEQQDAIGVKLKISDITCDNSAVDGWFNFFGRFLVDCKLKQHDDGSYTVTPRSFLPVAFLLMAGEYTVTTTVDRDNTVTAQGHFTLVPRIGDFIDLFWLFLILLFLAYIIYILFIKYKFRGQTVRCDVYQLEGNGRGTLLNGSSRSLTVGFLSGGLLLPTRASSTNFKGITLKAGPDGEIYITGKSIARAMKFYGTSPSDPKSALRFVISSLRSTEQRAGDKTERHADDMPLSANTPVYLRKSATDKQILAIYLRGRG